MLRLIPGVAQDQTIFFFFLRFEIKFRGMCVTVAVWVLAITDRLGQRPSTEKHDLLHLRQA